jgi:hypothetical protein
MTLFVTHFVTGLYTYLDNVYIRESARERERARAKERESARARVCLCDALGGTA